MHPSSAIDQCWPLTLAIAFGIFPSVHIYVSNAFVGRTDATTRDCDVVLSQNMRLATGVIFASSAYECKPSKEFVVGTLRSPSFFYLKQYFFVFPMDYEIELTDTA